ncbi:hypothetical protein NQ317_001812 [Molorchus minor]|uniref:DUF7041 domain-containing protein n=1 Tax=Molorchus minor TaxID=1323400 RepID=A0ABQ9JW84_9CUCU|nr:hypothetical protein NQ317_001812 [Molorchus minor]
MPNTDASHLSVKLPPFVPDDPDMWLRLVDITFTLAKITNEEDKFGYVMTALDPRTVVREVREMLMQPPKEKPYTTLKQLLVTRFSTSQEERIRMLLEREEIGDSKPSQLLRRLKSLAGTAFSESVLRTLWMDRLPQSIRTVLVTQKNTPLDEVAELADAIAESVSSKPIVCEATRPVSDADDRLAKLEQQISAMTRQMAKLCAGTERHQFRRSSRSRSRGRTQNRDTSVDVKRHGERNPFIFKDLATAKQVFVRFDGVKKQLQNPYDGPFTVTSRDDKTLTVIVRGREPAYVENEELLASDVRDFTDDDEHNRVVIRPRTHEDEERNQQQTETSTFTTRSGRTVRFPNRLQAGFS